MRTLKQIVVEFWLPFAAACAWTAFVLWRRATAMDIVTTVAVFGPTFFLCSWLTGQFFRVRKQTRVEESFTDVSTRLECVLERIETSASQMLDNLTGGDTFCRLEFVQVSNMLVVLNEGRSPPPRSQRRPD
jgi:hypothetical protein